MAMRVRPKATGWSTACCLEGLIGLPIAASITVDAATEIARRFHVSDEVIGLTLVALGTSLPELATTLTAAIRGQAALAIGNVLGIQSVQSVGRHGRHGDGRPGAGARRVLED